MTLAQRGPQFLRFIVVGIVATAIHYALLIAFVELLGWDPVPASALGFALSACVNYVLNRGFTFQSKAKHTQAALRFAIVALTGLGWTALLMYALTDRLNFAYLLAQVCTTGLVLIWNFFGNALWSFAVPKPAQGNP
jgi:putative flippase GtrA